jgi:hypothetical protein
MGAGSHTTFRLLQAVKLNRIEIWSSQSSGASVSTVSILWQTQYGAQIEHSDSSTSTTFPAHLITTPPPQSLASFWSTNGSDESEVLFQVSANQYSIIDVHMDLVMADGAGVTVTTTGNTTADFVYICCLDGAASAGVLTPVSVVSIF